MAVGNKILVAMRAWVQEQLDALRAWVETSLSKKAAIDAAGKLEQHLLYRGYTTDAKTAVKPGIYYYNGLSADCPSQFGIIEVKTQQGDNYLGLVTGNDWLWQVAYSADDGRTFARKVTNGGTWPDWVLDATATPPEEHALPLVAGYAGGAGGAWYFKEQNNKVTLTVCDVRKSDATGLVTGIIGTLPIGYRPTKLISVGCAMWEGGNAPGLLQALPDGNVWITVAAVGCKSIHGQLTFVAASTDPMAQ